MPDIPNYEWLRDEFLEVCEYLGADADPEPFIDDVLARYNEGRAYHNTRHLLSVLMRINHLADEEGRDRHLAKLAAFYHDVVYVPGWALNEVMSWEYAKIHMNYLGFSEFHFTPVEQAIRATKDHHPDLAVGNPVSRLLIDADLFELGTDNYAENGVNVRAEFADVPEPFWVRGRKKFLHTYLNRDQLFTTPGQYELELKARDNMEAELVNLIEGGV